MKPETKASRLDVLSAKINRGEHLTNAERGERQGILFNHSGRVSFVSFASQKPVSKTP